MKTPGVLREDPNSLNSALCKIMILSNPSLPASETEWRIRVNGAQTCRSMGLPLTPCKISSERGIVSSRWPRLGTKAGSAWPCLRSALGSVPERARSVEKARVTQFAMQTWGVLISAERWRPFRYETSLVGDQPDRERFLGQRYGWGWNLSIPAPPGLRQGSIRLIELQKGDEPLRAVLQ